MNAQLKKIALGLAIAAMPLFAMKADAQWTNPSIGNTYTIGDRTPTVAANPAHSISLSQNGTLEGRIASLDTSTKAATGLAGLNVFFVKNNQVVSQTLTRGDGSFTAQGLTQGAYSFYAAGRNGFAAYGVYVTQPQSGSLNVLEATTASANYHGIQQLLQQNVPIQVAQSVTATAQSVVGGTTLTNAKQVQLQGGRLTGRISSLIGPAQTVSGLQVHLIQNNESVAQVQTDAAGSYSIPDVEPGIYDIVAVGTQGFAATRFEAVGSRGPITQIAYRKSIAQEMDMALTCCQGEVPVVQGNQPVDYSMGNTAMEPSYAPTASAPIEYAGESVAYGGASGGSCGCAGNFGGFSGGGLVRGRFGGLRAGGAGGAGVGRLLTLGALAGGVVAIAQDEDDASPNN